jgi:hypothetical protein
MASSAAAMSGRAFLSVIAWPERATRDQLAGLMAEVTGIEVATARLRLGNQPPLILGMFDEATAGRAVNRITSEGGLAFAPSVEDIENLGPTIKIRDMRLHAGRMYLDLWRGEPTNIDPKSIEVIIRGRRSEKKVRPAASASPMFNAAAWRVHPMPAWGSFGAFGSYGIATALYVWMHDNDQGLAIEDGGLLGGASRRELRQSHMIDLHADDGRVFQIDADKFGFQMLGEQRGHGDIVNTDRLCDMIAGLAPGVTVDPYFSLWRPPVEIGRVRIAQVNRNREDPAFALYSRWSALLYRHMNQRLGQ